jgi:hypothetical protein
MTTITAKVVADSISPEGIRLTTMHLRYPRFIHPEFMTHRVFSRNARSSRAVPIKTIIDEVVNDPVVPLFWGKNQKGMQASEENHQEVIIGFGSDDYVWGSREEGWLIARDAAVNMAREFERSGYHKQVVNRLLEPFMHIDTLVTATDWDNFFALRDHKDAEPHIQVLARSMRDAMNASTPQRLVPGQWHLPYVPDNDAPVYDFGAKRDLDLIPLAIKVSVARCARISYRPFDGNATIEAELQRYEDLVGSQPIHASPAEHQATPDERGMWGEYAMWWDHQNEHGNFCGWRQYRKMLPGESTNTPQT